VSYSNTSYLRTGGAALSRPKPGSATVGLLAAPSLLTLATRLYSRIAARLRAYAQASAEQRRARESVRKLMALGNRELQDMGISRSEILSVVYGPRDARRVKYHADS
jgi:uncharacterized protein YjiS (DUF1127 family)